MAEDSPASYTLLIVDRAAREGAPDGQAQSMGTNRGQGYSAQKLRQIHATLSQSGDVPSRLYELNPLCTKVATEDACVLVIKLPRETADGALREMRDSVKYSLYKRSYGRTVRAKSRNISYVSNFSAPEDPDTNAPSVTDWQDLPYCRQVQQFVNGVLSDTEAEHAVAIRYEDYRRCGIRWHGDAERSKTLVARLGPNSKHHPFYLMWYKNNIPISDPFPILLEHGDVCIPSHKAVGSDFKRSSIPTLRHATGFVRTDGPVPNISGKAQKRMRGE